MNIYAKLCTWNYYKVQRGFCFLFRHELANQLPASDGLVTDSAAKTTAYSKVQRVLTGSVGTVCPAPEVVLQQLVRPCGTGAGHQPHGGLVKKHLADAEKKPREMQSQRVFPLPVSAATYRRVSEFSLFEFLMTVQDENIKV